MDSEKDKKLTNKKLKRNVYAQQSIRNKVKYVKSLNTTENQANKSLLGIDGLLETAALLGELN
tara:strand:- start:6391 stop:6579 length:189 start_codon:yes stop_codon:yes gene_type:complete